MIDQQLQVKSSDQMYGKAGVEKQPVSADVETVLQVEGVSKRFCHSLKRSLLYGLRDVAKEVTGLKSSTEKLRSDEFWAIEDISFELRRGECLGLIGHNGAGKSTLLKMINGLFNPDRGSITVNGRVGALIQLGAGFNPILTGRENIYINAAVLGLSKQEIDEKLDEIIKFAELEEFIDSPVQFYSSGMYARLGFSVAAHMNPDLLLIDEILNVGDVSFQSKSFNRMGEIKATGAAIILVSHNLHHISRFCDRVLYLEHGKMVCLDEPHEAVGRFMNDMMAEQKQKEVKDGADFSEVNGNGKVVLERAVFLDCNHREVTSIKSGESVTFRVYYRRTVASVVNPMFDVLIRDQEGIFFQGTNHAFGYEFGELAESGCIDVYFESLPANNQVLNFFFSLWNSTMTELYDWKRYVKLEVAGNPLSTGRVLMACKWQQKQVEVAS